jgi:hypothetical protein
MKLELFEIMLWQTYLVSINLKILFIHQSFSIILFTEFLISKYFHLILHELYFFFSISRVLSRGFDP